MNDFDFSKLKINSNILDNLPRINPIQDQMAHFQREQDELIQNITQTREKKETEELRRHNELIAALKSAGENGATILIGDNANGIQIQQNSSNSSQEMLNSVSFDYEKVLKVLKEVQEYTDLPQFETTFSNNTENAKTIIKDTIEAVEQKQNPTLIQKSLRLLKDLATGATGSLISSGILALLGTIQF